MPEIYFAQIREDGRAERALTASSGAQRIACIGSGGCTALSLLDDHISEVIVADANPAQCALIELKVAALRDLNRDEFLGFIGARPDTRRASIYRGLRPLLTDPAQKFWDKRIDCIATGINKIGVTERYYDFVGRNVRHSVVPQDILEELFATNCVERQHALFEEYFKTERWNIAMRILLSKQSNLMFYPAFWYARAKEHEFEELLLPKLMQVLSCHSAPRNYFLSQLLLGRYLDPDQDGAPHYLSREGYAAARRNLEKMRLVNLPIQAMLGQERDIDGFFLSNIFDWGKEVHAREVWEAVQHAAAPGAVFLFRNMYRKSDIHFSTPKLIKINDILSHDFQAQERSMLYRHIQTGKIH
jgi:S-adenosylmethionine-diacylglycerol 3-amino-3-carboxypropyl transferase